MPQFTRDLWESNGLTIKASGRGIIANCPTPQNGGVMECSANADLIAAAPELYEALEDIKELADKIDNSFEAQQIWEIARDAIAKAVSQ